MRTILVGVDFSPESEIAIEHALVLARRLDCGVTLGLATYVPDNPDGLSPGLLASYARYSADFKQRLHEEHTQLEQLRERFVGRGVELSQVVIDGRPDEAIVQAGKELDAVAVVVGTHGRSGFRRIAMGSVAEKVVRVAERPVLVARGAAPARGYRRIVVGFDFSLPSKKALHAALSYLPPGGELDVLHCWQLPLRSYARSEPLPGEHIAQFQTELMDNIRATGEQWLAEVEPVDGAVHFHGLEQTPAAGLDAWAAQHQADLIVVGSHGHQGLRRWLIGSVAETTVRHAPCSVVVVH